MERGKPIVCYISGKILHNSDAINGSTIRNGVKQIIKKEHPEFTDECYISRDELKRFRQKYIEDMIKKEQGELSRLDKEVVNSMVEHETLVKKMDSELEKELTIGEKMSDSLSKFGGSWKFITIFISLIFVWIIINSLILINGSFDPYPYILLNLILGVIASLQAPVIMMSQNRIDAMDRKRAENDYKINLKAELEIRHLHEKIDNLTQHQWKRLFEIQELQMELTEENKDEIRRRAKLRKNKKR